MKYLLSVVLFIFIISGCASKEKDVSSYGNDSASHQKEKAQEAYKELK